MDRIQEVGRRLKGARMEFPPPLCHPASQQGCERWRISWQRSLEGLGGVLGFWGKFLRTLSTKESGGGVGETTGVSSWRRAFIKLDDILLIMTGGKNF